MIESAVTSALDALGVDYQTMPCDPEFADTAAFCERYGTHVIASVVYGSGCYLEYNMQFNSVASQAAFSAKFSESYSGFGAKEKMSDQINTCLLYTSDAADESYSL